MQLLPFHNLIKKHSEVKNYRIIPLAWLGDCDAAEVYIKTISAVILYNMKSATAQSLSQMKENGGKY